MWFLFSWGLKANSRQAGYQSGFGPFSCLRIVSCFDAGTRTTERKFTNWGRRWLRSWGTWQCDDKHREMLSFSSHFYTHMYFTKIYFIISYCTISCYQQSRRYGQLRGLRDKINWRVLRNHVCNSYKNDIFNLYVWVSMNMLVAAHRHSAGILWHLPVGHCRWCSHMKA